MDCIPIFKKALAASGKLNILETDKINQLLLSLSDAVAENIPSLLTANRKDLNRLEKSDPKYDRLLLSPDRITRIAGDIRNVAGLPSPVGRILLEKIRPNGLRISKISVPVGVIGIIYEARPNVTFDVFSLCIKSGNVSILKGGSDSIYTNRTIMRIIKSVLRQSGIDQNVTTLLPPGRNETTQLLNARGWVDMIIPRGNKSLIDFVRKNATIPVIETGAGVCHTFFDESGDKEKGRDIVNNAKTRRVSVCNALDCLVIHESRLKDLDYLVGTCSKSEVLIYADKKAYGALMGKYPRKLLKPATKDSFGIEFLSYKMAVKTVTSFKEGLTHIADFGSKHSEAIISEDPGHIREFFKSVDASALYSNTSTAFTDGAEFGLGAEIGISTQKLHARGPMGLEELTTYKWIIEGDGQVRPG
jgi:glutamate-5-semialdehyde dehydrogenase